MFTTFLSSKSLVSRLFKPLTVSKFQVLKFSSQTENSIQDPNEPHKNSYQENSSSRIITSRISTAKDYDALTSIINEINPAQFNKIHVAATVARLKTLKSTETQQRSNTQNQQVIDTLWSKYYSTIERLSGDQLGSTTHGISRLGIKLNSQQKKQLMSIILNNVQQLNLKNISQILQGLANMNITDQQVCEQLCQQLKQIFQDDTQKEDFKFYNVLLSMWAVAKLQFKDNGLLCAFGDLIFQKYEQFGPKEISMIAWIYGKLKVQNVPVLFLIQDLAKQQINNFGWQDVSNFLWGLSESGHKFTQQHDRQFCQMIAQNIQKQQYNLKPQELSNILLVFARTQTYSPRFLSSVGDYLSSIQFKGFNGQNISNILWSFTSLRYRHDKLMQAGIQIITQNLDKFEAKSYATLVWCISQVDFRENQQYIFGLIGKQIVSDIQQKQANFDDLLQIAWSFALADYWDITLLNQLQQLVQQKWHSYEKIPRHICQQLAHIDLLGLPHNVKFLNQIDEKLEQFAIERFTQRYGQLTSDVQNQDFLILRDLGFEPQMEFGILDGRMSVDIFIEYQGERIAVESDGYHHFYRSQSKGFKPMGGTLARNRMLEWAGCRVVSLPFFERGKDMAYEEMVQYIQSKLLGEQFECLPEFIEA